MQEFTVADLIGVPYKENGRDKNGLDCYGLAIEVERRMGKELIDVYYENHDEKLADEWAPLLNIKKVDKIYAGVLLEMRQNGELHVGVALNDTTMIHATINQGVRISRIGTIPLTNIYEVVSRYGSNSCI